jgi:hypothetical protein
MDLTGAISYFGSPSAKERIAADLAEHRLDLTARKEILWESETASDEEVREKERHFIRETGANNPAIGYNLVPRFSHGGNDLVTQQGTEEADAMIPPDINLDSDKFARVLVLEAPRAKCNFGARAAAHQPKRPSRALRRRRCARNSGSRR